MKRDRDLLRELLIELQQAPEGFLIHSISSSSTAEDLARDHHFDLLMDEDLVTRKGNSTLRLTPLGHDAVEAIGKSETWQMLKAKAPSEAYEAIKGIGGTLVTSALSRLMGWN